MKFKMVCVLIIRGLFRTCFNNGAEWWPLFDESCPKWNFWGKIYFVDSVL